MRPDIYKTVLNYISGLMGRKTLLLLLTLSILAGILEFVLPFIAQYSLDIVLPAKNIQKLHAFAVNAGAIYCLIWIISTSQSYIQSELMIQTPNLIRADLFEKQLKRYSFNNDKSFAETARTIETDSHLMIQTLMRLINLPVRAVLVITGGFIFLYGYDMTYIMLVTSMLFLQWSVSYVMNSRTSGITAETRKIIADITDFISDCFSKLKSIHFFNASGFMKHEYSNMLYERQKSERNLLRLKRMELAWNNALSYGFKFITAFYIGKKIMGGFITAGEAAFILIIMAKIQGKFLDLFQAQLDILMLNDPLIRIHELIRTHPEPDESKIHITSFESIEFISVNYSADSRNIVSDMNFIIKKGEKVVFTGPSGIGKTTLFNLMTGLITPVSGTIKLNSLDLAEYDMKSWRKIINILPQENEIFRLSLSKNIALGRKISDDILQHCCLEHAEESICRGSRIFMSHGEQRRIAIARAMAIPCEIALLDEPDAHLDAETSEKILSHVFSTCKTSVIFSTRIPPHANLRVIKLH